MKGENKKLLIKYAILAVLVLITLLLLFKKSPSAQNKICEENVFIETGMGTYTYCKIVYPEDFNESMPLVAIAHGFGGTLNSGGAGELALRLAHSGIASVRVDFNPRIEPTEKSPKTNTYTLKTMEENLVRSINYMVGNYNIDTSKIGLYGRSLGGRVVMTLANESIGGYKYKALAMVAPAGNKTAMIDYMGGEENWENMKDTALRCNTVSHQGLVLTYDWFKQFEDYNPCEKGEKFGNKPVLVICNTLDYVVTDETSRECAAAYKNSRVITVTTEDYHGYEMSYEKSKIKDYLMEEIVLYFKDSL